MGTVACMHVCACLYVRLNDYAPVSKIIMTYQLPICHKVLPSELA